MTILAMANNSGGTSLLGPSLVFPCFVQNLAQTQCSGVRTCLYIYITWLSTIPGGKGGDGVLSKMFRVYVLVAAQNLYPLP